MCIVPKNIYILKHNNPKNIYIYIHIHTKKCSNEKFKAN